MNNEYVLDFSWRVWIFVEKEKELKLTKDQE